MLVSFGEGAWDCLPAARSLGIRKRVVSLFPTPHQAHCRTEFAGKCSWGLDSFLRHMLLEEVQNR